MKICKTCKIEKDFSEFYSDKRMRDNFQSSCKLCHNLKRKEIYWKNPEKSRADIRHWRTHKPDSHREGNLRYQLKQKQKIYGFTDEEFEFVVEQQLNGICSICFRKQPGKLCMDHCHTTGQFRGLLCRQCNAALGLLKLDGPNCSEIIRRISEYLQCFQESLA